MNDHIVTCRNLCKDYGGVRALDQVNLTLGSGRIVGLLGPNGSGKTTLLKIANGLLTPSAGEILLDGHWPGKESKAVVSYLPDASYLPDWMNIDSLVGMFADFYRDFDEKKAREMIVNLGLLESSRLKTLSKGNKEKIQLILAMSRKAKIYFLDEPIGGVDPAARDYILHTILANYNEESTILLSTHLIHDIENILDRVVFLKEGRLAMNAPVDDIRMEQGRSIDTLFREVFRC